MYTGFIQSDCQENFKLSEIVRQNYFSANTWNVLKDYPPIKYQFLSRLFSSCDGHHTFHSISTAQHRKKGCKTNQLKKKNHPPYCVSANSLLGAPVFEPQDDLQCKLRSILFHQKSPQKIHPRNPNKLRDCKQPQNPQNKNVPTQWHHTVTLQRSEFITKQDLWSMFVFRHLVKP